MENKKLEILPYHSEACCLEDVYVTKDGRRVKNDPAAFLNKVPAYLQEFVDLDYLEGRFNEQGECLSRPLTAEEKAWLSNNLELFYRAGGPLRDSATRQEISESDLRNNSRRRDFYNYQGSRGEFEKFSLNEDGMTDVPVRLSTEGPGKEWNWKRKKKLKKRRENA